MRELRFVGTIFDMRAVVKALELMGGDAVRFNDLYVFFGTLQEAREILRVMRVAGVKGRTYKVFTDDGLIDVLEVPA